MRVRMILALAGIATLGGLVSGQSVRRQHLNPVIELLDQKKAVFGLYAPSNRRGRGGPGGAVAPAETPAKSPVDLAREAVAYKTADYLFDGSMEGGLARGFPAFSDFVAGMREVGAVTRTPAQRLTHPLFVKTPKISRDPAKAIDNISRQLDLGVNGIVFVEVESAGELRQGLAAMRYKSNGGTRPDTVGSAPALWGVSEKAYRQKADLWPLNPDGELVNYTIVESKEGLAHVREIAAVRGIGALFPGAGTLRGVFTTTGPDGQRVFDEKGWEGAIQQVLAACKEFHVPCGYPANANDIEMRMTQGFSVFVINWGDAGFKAVEIGRRIGNRETSRAPEEPVEPVDPWFSTFSIIVVDPATNELGVGVQSRAFAAGAAVPYAKAGVGAVATQAAANQTYGPKAIALLEQGLSPAEVVKRITDEDAARDRRQVAVIDTKGRSAVYTGKHVIDRNHDPNDKVHYGAWAGHVTGTHYSVQGNTLASEAVVKAMAEAYERGKGSMAERLMDALDAGQSKGGDVRGMQSAGILVVRPIPPNSESTAERIVDIRVDDAPNPFVELRRILKLALARGGR